eukprot:5230000-Pyramimonas_sp.AAC.3
MRSPFLPQEGLINNSRQEAQPSPRGCGSGSAPPPKAAAAAAATPTAMPALRRGSQMGSQNHAHGLDPGSPGTRGEDLAALAKDRPAPSAAEEGGGEGEGSAQATPEGSSGVHSIPNREDGEVHPIPLDPIPAPPLPSVLPLMYCTTHLEDASGILHF